MQAQAWHYPVPVIFCDCTRKSVFALVPGCRQHWIDLGTYVWKKGSGKVVWGQILASKNHNWEFACYTTSHCFSTYGVGIVCSLNFRILRLKNKKKQKKTQFSDWIGKADTSFLQMVHVSLVQSFGKLLPFGGRDKWDDVGKTSSNVIMRSVIFFNIF